MIPTSLTYPPPLLGVLVPLDGSQLSEQAVAVGAARAKRTGATLHLVSVHQPYPPLAMPPELPMPTCDLEKQAIGDRRQYVDTVAAAARATLHTPVLAEVLTGEPAQELSRYVESHDIDLVVMTTHGRTGMSRLWLGSVADRLLRRLSVPVLLLHPSEAPQPTEFSHLLVALDGQIEEPVLDAMVALGARPGKTRCILACVVEPTIPVLSGLARRPAHLPPDWITKHVEQARKYLTGLVDAMVRIGWDVDCQVPVGRGVAAQVLAVADATAADCVVVGTRGARGLERLVLGSVADKIVRGTRLPVLVAPVGHMEHQEVVAGAHGQAARAIAVPAAAPA